MTTESNEIVTENEERSMDVLLNTAYADMTEGEIARVVEYKAGLKAQQADYEARRVALEQHHTELIEQAKTACDKAFEVQNALYQASLKRLNTARGGGAVGQA